MSWAVTGTPVPDPFANTLELFGFAGLTNAEPATTDTGQAFAVRLSKAIAGYRTKLDPTDDIVVLGLDSATTGRMAITFYRELEGSEFLDRIESWHTKYAWPQNFGKGIKFTGAPAPRDIAEAAFGSKLIGESGKKLRKATIERILPCIVDGLPIPIDFVESTRCLKRKLRDRLIDRYLLLDEETRNGQAIFVQSDDRRIDDAKEFARQSRGGADTCIDER